MTPSERMQEIVAFEPMDNVHHVYPTFGKVHDTSGEAMCWCWPVIGESQFYTLVIHNAEH